MRVCVVCVYVCVCVCVLYSQIHKSRLEAGRKASRLDCLKIKLHGEKDDIISPAPFTSWGAVGVAIANA